MEFTISRDIFMKSLSHAYGIIEKKTTLPILSNILIEAKDQKIKIVLRLAVPNYLMVFTCNADIYPLFFGKL